MSFRAKTVYFSIVFVPFCLNCDKVSFHYHEEQRPRPVTVIREQPVREVHVVERPTEVHVVHPPVREVHVVEHDPIIDVHVHAGHRCSSSCLHYHDGSKYIVVGKGHRHGPGCGHVLRGSVWVVEGGKARNVDSKPLPPRKIIKK